MPSTNEDDQKAQSEADAAAFDTFSGLRNTVDPERMGPRELARAVNVDLDDAGELHRRRGYRKVLIGKTHSVYATDGLNCVVLDGTLVSFDGNYTTKPLLAGIGPSPLSYVRVGQKVYASSITNSFQIDLATREVRPWGRVVDHAYQPGLEPAAGDWWYSPIVNPETDAGLGAVRGKLLGPPPLGGYLAYFNGRIYIGAGRYLWATEPFLYAWVNKTRGFRQFTSDIKGIVAVADGLFVGTADALYFLKGRSYEDQTRDRKMQAGVVPGTMIEVPAEVVSPEGRRRPDIPQQAAIGMACMTSRGQVIGLETGDTFNLTEASFLFPSAERGAAVYREQDGMKQIVTTLNSGGTPRDGARIGDYCDAVLIRAADRPKSRDLSKPVFTAQPPSTIIGPPYDNSTPIYDLAGTLIGYLEPVS